MYAAMRNAPFTLASEGTGKCTMGTPAARSSSARKPAGRKQPTRGSNRERSSALAISAICRSLPPRFNSRTMSRTGMGAGMHPQCNACPRVECYSNATKGKVSEPMCGIAGFYLRDGQASLSTVRAMCDQIRHRGPDDEGYHVEGGCAIGMRRLSIIDLSTGHQPMANEDESVWVVFNGEIYNYQELRRDLLARGHRFAHQ
jgi:hypothetical protein